jgi:hypothetical protein
LRFRSEGTVNPSSTAWTIPAEKIEEIVVKAYVLAAAALAITTTASLAGGATYTLKAGDGNYTGTNSQGNLVAYYSSDATGNGGAISGNGSAWNGSGSPDQTTTPGSRADAVQSLLAADGKGRDK